MDKRDQSDILQEIPDEDLSELARIYEQHKEEYPYVYSTIKTGIKWKTQEIKDNVIFLSPRNCWRIDGTFIAIFTFTIEADVILFSLDESGKNLYDGIKNTRRKQFDGEVNFYSTHDKFTGIVRKSCEDRGMINTLWITSFMVRMQIDTARNLHIRCPEEVYLKPLEVRDVPKINSVWPRKYNGSEIKLSILIKWNGGIGVYLKDNDELVAWVLRDQMGQVAALQTDEKYQGRGYASLVTKALSKQLAQEGIYPFAGINTKNTPSLKMFKKIGYEEIGPHTYFYMSSNIKSKI